MDTKFDKGGVLNPKQVELLFLNELVIEGSVISTLTNFRKKVESQKKKRRS